MHSIELLLDPAADAGVRAEWQALVDAGLPSQGRHSGATNAPHVTLLARPVLTAAADEALRVVLHDLPMPGRLGGLVVFGRPPRGLVLARLVVVTPRILTLHHAVHEAVREDAVREEADRDEGHGVDFDVVPTTLPGAWTPHVTLASRLSPEQLAAALTSVSTVGAPEGEISFAAARRWDSTAKTVTPL